MKKFKPFEFVRNSVFSLLLVSSMVSCQHMGEPVKEFFKEYTETAAIVYDDFGANYKIDNSGVYCLPYSEDGKEIVYTLRNPQHYDLNVSVTFPLESQMIFSAGGYNVEISKEDKGSVIRVHYPGELLYALEMGKDMSPTINIVEPKSGRVFSPYTTKFHVNSVPPLVSNQVVMLDSTNPDDLKYVVCFEFPKTTCINSESIHNDIAEFSIADRTYSAALGTFSLDSDGTISIAENSSTAPYITTQRPVNLVGNSVTGSNATFNVKDGQAFYFVTGTSLTNDNTTYSLIMKDRAGLSSVSYASVKAEKIGMVSATADGKPVREDTGTGSTGQVSTINQSEDGCGKLVFQIPSETVKFNSSMNVWEKDNDVDGVTVKYEVYCAELEESGGIEKWVFPQVPTASGTCTDTTPIEIPPVVCMVKAYATKYLYVDSETSVFYVKPYVSKMYVSDEGKDLSGFGTRENPCATITYALDVLDDKKNSANKILLVGDAEDSVAMENTTVEIAGLDGMRKISADGGFTVGRNSNVTFRNVAISGINGNGITLSGTENEPSTVNTYDAVISGFGGAGIADVSGGYGVINLGNNSVITGNRSGIESSGNAIAGTVISVEGKVVVDGNGSSSGHRRNLVIVGSSLPGNPMANPVNVTGSLSFETKIGVTLSGTRPDTGLPVVITKDFEKHNPAGLPRSFFVYDNDEFGISSFLEEGEAKVVLGGGQIVITKPEVSFTIYAHGIAKSGSLYVIPYASGGTAVRFTPHYTEEIKDHSLTNIEVILRKMNDSVVIGNSLECLVPDYGPGMFQIIVRGIYAGSAFSDTFEIKLEGNE